MTPFRALTEKEKFNKAPAPRSRPLWDLYRDGLTQGAIEVFLVCREQFRLQYEEGWTRKEGSNELEFGSAFHEVLARAHAHNEPPSKSVAAYKRRRFREVKFSLQERDEFSLLLAQVQVVAEAYLTFWGKVDQGKKWVARERVFHNPLPTITGQRDTIETTGRWDGLFRTKDRFGKLWLHETKTKGNIDEDGIRLSLPLDLQTMLYCDAAENIYEERVYGTLYDVVRRPQLRRGNDEGLAAFVQRIQEDITKRPRWYFMRWEVTLRKEDLENYRRTQLYPILRQIAAWNHNRKENHFINSKALFSRFGSRCDMFGPITTQNYYGLYRRKVCYPELVD